MRKIFLMLVVMLTTVACNRSTPGPGGGGAAPATPGKIPYSVEVTRTALGIPHIKGDNFGSVGYGYGYAHAEDNLCVLQEDFVTIRGERTKFYGRDGSYFIVPNGSIAANIDSDFFWKLMATDARLATSEELGRAGVAGGVPRLCGWLEPLYLRIESRRSCGPPRQLSRHRLGGTDQ